MVRAEKLRAEGFTTHDTWHHPRRTFSRSLLDAALIATHFYPPWSGLYDFEIRRKSFEETPETGERDQSTIEGRSVLAE